MNLYRQTYRIRSMDFIHAGEASVAVKNLLQEIGANPALIRRVAIASYEAEMNAVMYGGGGVMILEIDTTDIHVRVEDEGPGISDLSLAMQEGWSTATPEMREMGFGAGMGLPNIKRNADDLDIQTTASQGTHLHMIFKTGWEEDPQ